MPRSIEEISFRFERDEINRAAFLDQCTRTVGEAIGCSRVGFWLFIQTAEGLLLRCVTMHDRVVNRAALPSDEMTGVEAYFSALKKSGYVMANDVSSHAATTGLFATRLANCGVRSLLATSCSLNGAVYGAFTCTQLGREVSWTMQQLNALRHAAAQSSLSLFRAKASRQAQDWAPSVFDPFFAQPLATLASAPSSQHL